jgi:hypothetical protein
MTAIRVEVRRVDAGILLQVDNQWHVVFRSDDDAAAVGALLVEVALSGPVGTEGTVDVQWGIS